MAITKQTIVDVLNRRLGRSETLATLAAEIRGGLRLLSQAANWKCLLTMTEFPLVLNTGSIQTPDGFKQLKSLYLLDGNNSWELEPFRDLSDYFLRKATSTAKPTSYTQSGTTIYLDPASNGVYTIQLHYWRYHPDQDAILFPDIFEEAVCNAVMVKYLESLRLQADPKYAVHVAALEREIATLGTEIDRIAPIVAPPSDF